MRPPAVQARKIRLFAAAIGLAAGLTSCGTTPTLPLPPPVISNVGAPSLQGLVRVDGEANEDAYVTVLNTHTDRGAIMLAGDDGRFSIEIEAQVGDALEIWQEQAGIVGERVQRVVPAPGN